MGIDTEVRNYAVEGGDGVVWLFTFDGPIDASSCATVTGSRCTTPLARETIVDGEALVCETSGAAELVLCGAGA